MALVHAVRLGGTGEKMHDELLRPTIDGRAPSGARPWRPLAIAYPAYLAGPLTAAVLGAVNGHRLGPATTRLAAIGAAGLFAFGARVALSPPADDFVDVRQVGGVAGLLVWLVVLGLQGKPFRAYLRGRARPSSLVRPGLAAVLGCGLLELGVIYGLVR
jgi:hypothetical protein